MKKLMLVIVMALGMIEISSAFGSHWDVVDNYGNRGNYNFMTNSMCQQFVHGSGGYWVGCVLVND